MIGLIWAESPERIIGIDNRIPWRYSGDFKRFKRVTMGAAIIMGRKTWESIGKALPGRLNIIVSKSTGPFPADIVGCTSIEDALKAAAIDAYRPVWFIGGARIYAEAMQYADVLDVTYIPAEGMQKEFGSVYTFAPTIDESLFEPGPLLQHEDEPALKRREYRRRR